MTGSILAALLVAVAVDAAPDAGAQDARAMSETGETDAEVRADAGAEASVSADAEPLASAPLLSGRVLARGTREPLLGAQVRVILGKGATRDTETDESGGFSLAVGSGPCEVHVRYPGFEPFSRNFDVGEHGLNGLVLRLQPRLIGDRYETVVMAAPERAPAVPVQREELTHTPGASSR